MTAGHILQNKNLKGFKDITEERHNVKVVFPRSIPNGMVNDQLVDYVKRAPRKRNLRYKRLISILGGDLDNKWMSVTSPPGLNQEIPLVYGNQTLTVLKRRLDNINIDEFDASGHILTLESFAILKNWLLKKASCGVIFKWVDLGPFFWPRFIKRGNCPNSRTCSWPPGMHCVPAESHTISLLRWHCWKRNGKSRTRRHRQQKDLNKIHKNHGYNISYFTNFGYNADWAFDEYVNPDEEKNINKKHDKRLRKDKKRRKTSCKWIKVPFPVTADCYCSC